MEKVISNKCTSNQASITIFKPENKTIDFKSKVIRRDRVGNCIIIKGKIYQEGIAILCKIQCIDTDDPNSAALKFIKETILMLNSYIDLQQVSKCLQDTLPPTDRSSRQTSKGRNTRGK